MIRKIVSSVILILLIFTFSQELNTKSNTDFIQVGEELLYEVSFFGVKLGTIKMVMKKKDEIDGKPVIYGQAYIDSYDGIPFVDLHVIYNSWMHPKINYSYKFISNMKEDDGWYYEKITFDYQNKKIKIEGFKKKKRIKNLTIKTKRKWFDGFSLFHVARKLLYIKKNVSIPTLMGDDTVFTTINFSGKKKKVDIDAVDYPVRTVYFNGNANWTGVYGMTGEFEGWFSDDKARVPIKAKMKVYVGSVNIELIKWKRPDGWKPPR